MEINPFSLQYIQLPGERYDTKLCFESRDEHFACMDHFKDLNGNLIQFKLTTFRKSL
jgi:hypothetical protein